MATRQTTSSGRPKSPRIQVVLPEDLCQRLADLAACESRSVSNLAKVLIQQGVERLEAARAQIPSSPSARSPQSSPERFREALEHQERSAARRLRGVPRRLRLQRPG